MRSDASMRNLRASGQLMSMEGSRCSCCGRRRLDTSRNLLFIVRLGDGEVIAFDTYALRAIARIADVSSVHGVLAAPELSRICASATGTDEIVAIDAAIPKIGA